MKPAQVRITPKTAKSGQRVRYADRTVPAFAAPRAAAMGLAASGLKPPPVTGADGAIEYSNPMSPSAPLLSRRDRRQRGRC
jgi:hypothetical protein